MLEHYALKKCARDEVKLHAFLTSTLNGEELSASCFGHFTPMRMKKITKAVR